jgi:hypothetical protein
MEVCTEALIKRGIHNISGFAQAPHLAKGKSKKT